MDKIRWYELPEEPWQLAKEFKFGTWDFERKGHLFGEVKSAQERKGVQASR